MSNENIDVKESAFLLSNGIQHEKDAKTSHGLIRGSDRFNIKAVVDSYSAGKDAGEVLDGIYRNISIYGSLNDAIEKEGNPVLYCRGGYKRWCFT